MRAFVNILLTKSAIRERVICLATRVGILSELLGRGWQMTTQTRSLEALQP